MQFPTEIDGVIYESLTDLVHQNSRLNKNIIKTINNVIVKDNYDIHQFDKEIDVWHRGGYCEGEKQAKIALPKTWKKK